MTVTVFNKRSEKFDKSGKMFFSSNTGYDKQQQQEWWCEESQSRVSFPPENRFPSESPLRRTMRPLGHRFPHYHSENNNRSSSSSSNNRLPTQKRSSTLSSSSSSSIHSSSSSHQSFPTSSSDNMLSDKSIQKPLSGRKFANLLSSSPASGESCFQSHYYPKLTSPSEESLVPSSASPSSQKSYHHHHISHHRHWASFGMILIAIIILSTFSTSSMVLCVPLGGTGSTGVEEARRAAAGGGPQSGLMIGMSPSKMVGLHRKLQQENNQEQSQGEMYLPSLLNHGGGESPGVGVAEQTLEEHRNLHHSSNTNNPSNYHHLNKPPIQKLHKDIARSIMMENPAAVDEEEDDDDSQDDSGEMNNQVERMVAPPPPPPHMSSASSLMGLGNIALGGGGGGESVGRDDDPNSSPDQMDQSSGGAPSGQWETVIDPHLYLLTEWKSSPSKRRQLEQQFSFFRQQRKRRNSGTGPSLSIVNPLDVLRQRLLLEIARRRMRQSQNQIIANEEILRKIGRR